MNASLITLVNVLVVMLFTTLATSMIASASLAVMHVWLRGGIFERIRARIEAWDNWVTTLLLDCKLCLSVHVTLWLTLMTLVPFSIANQQLSALWLMPLVWWSAIFFVNVFSEIWSGL